MLNSVTCILQEANSIVSIICGTNKIAWAHVDRALTVLNWQQEDCPNFMRGAYMASAYLEDVSKTSHTLSSIHSFFITACPVEGCSEPIPDSREHYVEDTLDGKVLSHTCTHYGQFRHPKSPNHMYLNWRNWSTYRKSHGNWENWGLVQKVQLKLST